MLTFITLCTFTDQGIRSIKDTTKRADMVMEAASKFGSKMTQLYWTQGQYDLIATIEAPDEVSHSFWFGDCFWWQPPDANLACIQQE